MGKIIQIRVTAQTYSPEDARKRWPKLYDLADIKDSKKQDVLTLIDRLHDLLRFGDIKPDQKQALEINIDDVLTAREEMEHYLAERQAKEADKKSYAVEDKLDKLEKDMPSR